MELSKSKFLFWIMLTLHILAMVALGFIPSSLIVKIILEGLCLVSFYLYLRKYIFLKSPKSISQFNFLGKEKLEIICRKGIKKNVEVLPNTFLGEWLIVLHLKEVEGKQKYYWVVLKDSFQSEQDHRSFARWCYQYFMA